MAILTLGLQNLRTQVDEAFPGRDKASDGWIGNAAHQAETSGHNPDDTSGSRPAWDGDTDSVKEVRAWDCDNDFGGGVDAQVVVDHIRRLSGVADVLRYLIYDRKIYHSRVGFTPAVYTGASAHTEHIHFEGAWTQAADNNTSFDFRLEEIPVALTAADWTKLEALVTRVVDARLDAAETNLIGKLPAAVGALKVNVKPGEKTPSMQPWSAVDAWGSPERAGIKKDVAELKAQGAEVAAAIAELLGKPTTPPTA